MPNIRIHEEIAYIFTKKHKEYDNNYFYLGVLAPDTPNLKGFGKKEDRWIAHQREKDLDKWQNKIIDFYNNNKNNYNHYFIFGYLFHVITDIVYDRDFYLNVRELILKDNIPIEETHDIMRKDMDYYGSKFVEYSKIKKELKEIKTFYSILNVNKQELEEWTKMNINEEIIGEPKYITKELINNIEQKVEEELKILI